MAKRTKKTDGPTPTGADASPEQTLWAAADALRGQMDASDYKHVVLGLIFLKYVSDAFALRRAILVSELEADDVPPERMQTFLEDQDEYTKANVFWVPKEARWEEVVIAAATEGPNLAATIDEIVLKIEEANPSSLKGKLPRGYARRGMEPEKLKKLVDLLAGIGFEGGQRKAEDLLGRVYEYFLGRFAQSEGKSGGEFYTPRSIVRLLVEMLEPYAGDKGCRVYDPCCGSGGMFIQAEKFVEDHQGDRKDVSIFGQESNPNTWKLAAMNLAMHHMKANLGEKHGDTFLKDQHPDLKADYILANPPFNISDYGRELLDRDVRWEHGDPPAGNANFAWIQHFLHHLAPPNGRGGGVAGFVMANGSLSSQSGGEGDIRSRLVEADLVDCIVALPPQLFYTTQIPVCLWILTRDKTGKNLRNKGRDRGGEVLFLDGRNLGRMVSRTLRELSGLEASEQAAGTSDPLPASDIGRLVSTFRQWRGEPAPAWWSEAVHGDWAYEDVPGFCKLTDVESVVEQGAVLTPGRWVGAEEVEDDGEAFVTAWPRMLAELEEELQRSAGLAETVRAQVERVDDDA